MNQRIHKRRFSQKTAGLITLPQRLRAPNVAGQITPISFGKFLELPTTRALFVSGHAGNMRRELIAAKSFHYFGLDAGKFKSQRARNKTALLKYVSKAYRGDARGIAYWRRVSRLL